MPYRVHQKNKCLSINPASERVSPYLTECQTIYSHGHMYSIYVPSQSFAFFPLMKTAQQIKSIGGVESKTNCLTSVNSGRENITRLVQFSQCLDLIPNDTGGGPNKIYKTKFNMLSQLFVVKQRSAYLSKTGLNASDYVIPAGKRIVSNALSPSVLAVSIAQVIDESDEKQLRAWYRHEDGGLIPSELRGSSLRCLTSSQYVQQPVAGLDPASIRMEPCDYNSKHQMFIIEKTSVAAWVKFVRKKLEYQHFNSKSRELG